MSFREYSADQVLVSFLGLPIEPGDYDEAQFLTIEPRTDRITLKVGAGGGGSLARSKDNSYNVTLRLLQSSPGHKDLLALYNVERHGGVAVGALLIEDLSAGITYLGANAAIVKDPVANYAAESENREWQFVVHNLVPVAAPDTGV
jgi:hypothetical protein